MLKHMKGDVLGVMRKLMRMNCPTPWTMYGGKDAQMMSHAIVLKLAGMVLMNIALNQSIFNTFPPLPITPYQH